jgi:peptide/nickel transport system permease protein
MSTEQTHLSPNQKAGRRFLQNKPAAIGTVFIVLMTFIALLGYWATGDKTPDCNDQVVEISLKPPNFGVKMLAIRKNRVFEPPNFFHTMFLGRENPYKMLPINSYHIKNDSIFVEKYTGETAETGALLIGKPMQFHIADVVYDVSNEKTVIEKSGENYIFINARGTQQVVNSLETQKIIENNLLSYQKFAFGTDRFGRSMLSRLILGVRISLLVGLIAVFISLTIGVVLGALAGYFGGKVDDLIMLIVNTIWSIPTLLLVFAIVMALGRGVGIIFIAVGLTMWVDVARIVRGQVMTLKEMQYIEAARSMGFGTRRIIFKHLLPNILGPVMVVAAANFASAILLEAGLSYLGFGIQPPTPSWGTMLNENYGFAISGKPFLALVPGVAIMLMVLAFNLVGNGLRDALDVRNF